MSPEVGRMVPADHPVNGQVFTKAPPTGPADIRVTFTRWNDQYLSCQPVPDQLLPSLTACIPLEEEREIKDQLIYSRSFSQPVADRDGMEQVLSIYAQMAATRLHRHQREAKVLTGWAMTSHFNDQQSHQPAVTVALHGY